MKLLNLTPIPALSTLTTILLLAVPWLFVLIMLSRWLKSSFALTLGLPITLVLCFIVLFFDVLIVLAIIKNRVYEEADGLRMQAMGVLRQQLNFKQVDWAQARWIDLTQERELRPRWRTMGMGLPGYLAGHFRLVNRQKCFVICRGKQAVYLPKLDGSAVILSLLDGAHWLKQKKAQFLR